MSWPYKERKEVRNVSAPSIWNSETKQLIPVNSQLLRLEGGSKPWVFKPFGSNFYSDHCSTLCEQESYQTLTPGTKATTAFKVWAVKEVLFNPSTTSLAYSGHFVSIVPLTWCPPAASVFGALFCHPMLPLYPICSLPHACHQGKKWTLETSLVVQGLRVQAPNAGDQGLIPGQGTRSHVL